MKAVRFKKRKENLVSKPKRLSVLSKSPNSSRSRRKSDRGSVHLEKGSPHNMQVLATDAHDLPTLEEQIASNRNMLTLEEIATK